MPTSRAIAAGLPLPSLVASALLGWCSPPAAWAQAGSALFAVGEPSRAQRPARQPPLPAATAASPLSNAGGPTTVAPRTVPARKQARRRSASASQDGTITLNGRWQDSQCIPLPSAGRGMPLHVQREFVFDDSRKRWQLQASVYTSSTCFGGARMLTYGGAGSFVVGGRSRGAPNAYDAIFRIDRWTATPYTREGVLALLNDRCGSGDFEQGRPLDLSVTGCRTLGIRPIAQAPQEQELVGLSNGSFFLGSRSFVPGRGDDRPPQLSSSGLVRSP